MLVAATLACLTAACRETLGTEVRGRRIARADLRQVSLGRTTPAEVEERFGVPAAREPDGALTYRFALVRRSVRHVGGWTISTDEHVDEHAVTFRFAHGVLARICRTRS